MSRRTSILEGMYVGKGVEPIPHSLEIVNIVMWYHCIRKLKGHACMTLRKEKVFFFLKNTKQTEQDNPCLWFPLFFYFAFHKNLAVTQTHSFFYPHRIIDIVIISAR